MNSFTLSAPVRLAEHHDCTAFSCGEPILDDWLRQQAKRGNKSGSASTYVVCDGTTVVGYYALATGAITRSHAPRKLQRNMPDPIPIVVLARLAIDRQHQRHGIGKALLKDASLRTLSVAEKVGVVALITHAISDDAKRYYLRQGFLESPIEEMTLCVPLATLRQTLK